jgi:hypothetical protein
LAVVIQELHSTSSSVRMRSTTVQSFGGGDVVVLLGAYKNRLIMENQVRSVSLAPAELVSGRSIRSPSSHEAACGPLSKSRQLPCD